MSPAAGRLVRVLWNASAGRKASLAPGSPNPTAEQLEQLLERHGLRVELIPTDSESEARQLASESVSQGVSLVVAAGGDGTIGAVASELLDTPVALGVLPLGSVMNVPRMLGLPRDLEAAAGILAAGRVTLVDVGEANGQPFYESASVGMNAAMFREAQRIDAGDYGSLLRSIWVALRYRPARMRVELDEGTIHTRALMVTISNGPYTGLGMTVAPEARLDDGSFDVVVFRHFSRFELLRHLLAIAFGRRRYTPRIRTYRSAVVRVTSVRPLPSRADSHDLGTTPLECRVRRAALRVVVPADFSRGRPEQA